MSKTSGNKSYAAQNKRVIPTQEYQTESFSQAMDKNGLRFYEVWRLKLSGRIDGKRGFPNIAEDGSWKSAFIQNLLDRFEETSSLLWIQLQIKNKGKYIELQSLIQRIRRTESALATARNRLNLEHRVEAGWEKFRNVGEEELSDAQVEARRRRERQKRLEPYKNSVATLERKLEADIERFEEVYGKLLEDVNMTKLICNKLKDNMLQKLNVYWNAALVKHPESQEMPMVPEIYIEFRSEEIYRQTHEDLMEDAEKLYQQLRMVENRGGQS